MSAIRTYNLEAGLPALDKARRVMIEEIKRAKREGIRMLKVIHGYPPARPRPSRHPTPHRRPGPVLSRAAGGARMQTMKQIDWSSVDWRKPVRQLAKEQGCCQQAVYLAQARRWNGLEKATKPTTQPRQHTPSLMKNLTATR